MSVNTDYLKLLNILDRNLINKILKELYAEGFTINGFNKDYTKAPLLQINLALKSKKKQGNSFLKKVAKSFGQEDKIREFKKKEEVTFEYISQIVNSNNICGIIAALLLSKPEEEETINSLFDNDLVSSINYEEEEEKIEVDSDEISGEYLCKIEHKYEGLYFINPQLKLVNNRFKSIPKTNLFGSTGKIKISTPNKIKLQDINGYKFYIITLNKDDLYTPTDDSKAQIFENKIFDSIKKLDEESIYEIFKISDEIDINSFKCGKDRIIQSIFEPMSRRIYVENKGKIYGPFSWENTSLGLSINYYGSSPYVNVYSIEEIDKYVYEIPTELSYEPIRKVLFHKGLSETSQKLDFISNNDLIDLVAKNISNSRNNKIEIRDIILKVSSLELSQERKGRILDSVNNSKLFDKTIDDLIPIILKEPEKLQLITDKIVSNNNYFVQIKDKLLEEEKFQEIVDKIDEKKIELDSLNKDINSLSRNKEDIQEKEKSQVITELENKIEKMQEQIEDYSKNISLMKEEYEIVGEIVDLKKEVEKYNRDIETAIENKIKYKNEIDSLTPKLEQKLSEASLNEFVANKMMQVINSYEKKNNLESELEIYTLKDLKDEEIYIAKDKDEFIDYIYNGLKERNNNRFSRNDIINILLCISQGFLTVFAGAPGTGKTSLCNNLAKVFGLNNKVKLNRYIEVSVEKGWTSKRDFIGYYNPLTKTFDKTNKSLFDAFNILNNEAKKRVSDFPYIILLDEANLSSMEYYWADFMNVCDFNKESRSINLCEDYNLKIPNTLRFLATINYDHTTEILSPRLIDRAWIILLNSNDINIEYFDDYEIDGNLPIVLYENFNKFFGADKKLCNSNENDLLTSEISLKLKEIYALFKEANTLISPRVSKMVRKYCVVGRDLFDYSENRYVALDYAVSQKILPLINGSGKEYESFLDQLEEVCDKGSMPLCNTIINNIIKKGQSMNYYQFFEN